MVFWPLKVSDASDFVVNQNKGEREAREIFGKFNLRSKVDNS